MLINEQHTAFQLQFDPNPISENDTILLFKENEVLLRTAAETDRLPLWSEVVNSVQNVIPLHAFTQGERRFFIAMVKAGNFAPAGTAFTDMRVFRTLQPAEDGALLITGYHLSKWYQTHCYCGACGAKTAPAPVERALHCDQCGLTIYPSILPAVIVAVTHQNKLLLARNAQGTWRHFSLIAGYVETGETIEQAVHREVLEEVGLHIKNVCYAASQPWGFSQSLMLGFTAELDGDAQITLQESELSEARWFRRAEMPHMDSNVSISYDLMERFRSGKIGDTE